MNVDRLSICRRPRGLPLMRQWWGKLLFMHWAVPAELLRPLVPRPLTIDTFDGRAWLGLIPFTIWGVRQSLLPPLPWTNALHELNVRTYVHFEGTPGVWFMSLDASNPLAVWGAQKIFRLPYVNARINLREQGDSINFQSRRTERGAPPADFEAAWTYSGEELEYSEPDSLPFFLTERYCFYSAYREELYRCRIHHERWPLRHAELTSLQSNVIETLGLPTPAGAPLLHYAEAIRTDIWPLERLRSRSRVHVLEASGATQTFS